MGEALHSAAFVELAKLVYLGATPDRDAQRQIEQRGVIEAINEVELMGGHYAGYADMMAAPAVHVARTRLVMAGRAQAEAQQAKDMEDEAKRGGSGSGSGGGGRSGLGRSSSSSAGDTHVSAYYPHQQQG